MAAPRILLPLVSVVFLLLPLVSIVFLLLLVPIPVSGQQQNISIGSTLDTSIHFSWSSPNGDFAFGFYQIAPTQYLIGVWSNNTDSTETLVWTANRDHPVEDGFTLQLSATGLHSQIMSQSIFPPLHGVHVAQMRDNGNFVLLDASNNTIWQSFDNPTDTLLPGQMLKPGSTMYSKVTKSNYSTGRFVLILKEKGDLTLLLADRMGDISSAYWNVSIGNSSTLNFYTNGLLSLVDNNSNGSRSITLGNDTGRTGREQFARRVTLDADGILREYVWIESDGDGDEVSNTSSWTSVWEALQDPCHVSGQCGLNGICRSNKQMLVNCTCPPGFHFLDNQDLSKGCEANSYLQMCSSSASASSVIMAELESIDWPGNDYATLVSLNESECKQACLDDCMCMVAIYGNGICSKKANPLRDGRINTSRKAFVKVVYSHDKNERKLALAIGISLVSCSSTFAAVFLIVWFFCCRAKLRTVQEQAKFRGGLKAFTYQEMYAATKGFRAVLGRGAFGTVYKGILSDGRAIAVKKLEKLAMKGRHDRGQGEKGEKEFRMEMNTIGASHHKNLVELYGFCDEGDNRLLVYQYMSNGSLDRALFQSNIHLDWQLRVQIALGAARGILYLHEECATQILHGDIKPQNILLDENFNAKISDFGLAKLIGAEQTRTFTEARGTLGYIAPEWCRNMAITVKVDVYSFGVMLLEIICCRKTVDLDAPENEIVLCEWVYECMKHGQLEKLVQGQEQQQQSEIDSRHLERMVLVGLWCIQQDPYLRPSIKSVVQMLEGTVKIAVPPSPYSWYLNVPSKTSSSFDVASQTSSPASNFSYNR